MLKALGRTGRFSEPCALLLGGFDGFHTGHASLKTAAEQTGLPVGITAISGNKAGGNLFTLEERAAIFSRAGFSFVAEYAFDEALKNASAEAFLRDLFGRVNVKAVFCGEDYRFGKDARGTAETLKSAAPCPVTVLPLVSEESGKISVSRIKAALAAGEISAANRLLYGGYFLQGIVEHGRRVGRTYGFPTLNLAYPAEKFPVRDGVYGGYAETPAGDYPAMINFGARPTFGLCEKKAEAYLKGFDGDLYGKTVRLFPQKFLRPVMRFSSAEALKTQLREDAEKI